MGKLAKKVAKDQRVGARKALLEELFQDFNRSRPQIYRLNFFRGIFFGLGSALGGTVVLAVVVWLLTLFTDIVPGLNALNEAIGRAAEASVNQ